MLELCLHVPWSCLHVMVSMYSVSETFTVHTKGQGFLDAFAFYCESNYVFVMSVHPSVCTHESNSIHTGKIGVKLYRVVDIDF